MATDFLQKILDVKREEVAAAINRVPETFLRERAEARAPGRSLVERLSRKQGHLANIIAEVKRRSPSKGALRPDLDPALLAGAYEAGGASAVSVLTDGTFFGGSPEDLALVRGAVSLPVLRKDFIVSTYQIHETAAMGADAMLLIVRAVPFEFLRDGLALAGELGLDVLVEAHSAPEIERAVEAGAVLVGINNRDLATFKTDLRKSAELAARLGPGQIPVAESGVSGRADIERLMESGIRCFLIGESLVKAEDPEGRVRDFAGGDQPGH